MPGGVIFNVPGKRLVGLRSLPLLMNKSPVHLCQGGIVDVALLFAGIESRLVRWIEGCIVPVARGQIRIGEKRHTERDEISFSACDRGTTGMRVVTAVHDHRAIEYLA